MIDLKHRDQYHSQRSAFFSSFIFFSYRILWGDQISMAWFYSSSHIFSPISFRTRYLSSSAIYLLTWPYRRPLFDAVRANLTTSVVYGTYAAYKSLRIILYFPTYTSVFWQTDIKNTCLVFGLRIKEKFCSLFCLYWRRTSSWYPSGMIVWSQTQKIWLMEHIAYVVKKKVKQHFNKLFTRMVPSGTRSTTPTTVSATFDFLSKNFNKFQAL